MIISMQSSGVGKMGVSSTTVMERHEHGFLKFVSLIEEQLDGTIKTC